MIEKNNTMKNQVNPSQYQVSYAFITNGPQPPLAVTP